MSYYLTDEIVKSLKEYTTHVEQAYHERHSIGQYVYSFVDEVDTLMRCY